jgi:hypothetical protein
LHGFGEGPTGSFGPGDSQILVETATEFSEAAKGKNVKPPHYIEYPNPDILMSVLIAIALNNIIPGVSVFLQDLKDALSIGVEELNAYVRGTVLKECPKNKDPKIVLVGYSLGTWIINEWLNREESAGGGKNLWKYISAVELYGDVLWRRKGPPYPAGGVDTYEGVLRRLNIPTLIGLPIKNDPYAEGKEVQGPGGELSKRWQSRCLRGDAWCGEGYGVLKEGYGGIPGLIKQIGAALQCEPVAPLCEHQKYALEPRGRGVLVSPALCGEDPMMKSKKGRGYGLTMCGASFLALKTFPSLFTIGEPHVAHYETTVEGVHVYIRLYYTGSAEGFGFVGIKGSGWGFEEHLFSSLPYWARHRNGLNRVDYPFNHLCGDPGKYESDIKAWVYSIAHSGLPVDIHLACSAPKEVITPFFDH